MEDRKHVLIRLFLSTLYLSAFTFGGGGTEEVGVGPGRSV